MREAVIVAGARTAVGRAKKGSLKDVHPVDMGAAVVADLLRRVPQLDPADIEDVIMGTAVPEAEQGMNMARLIGLRAGLPTNVAGITINRFCSSGLQTIAYAAQQIMVGSSDVVVAGGVESMSLVPMLGHKVALNPTLVETKPEAYMSMGHTAEEVARRYHVTREDQDAFALRSHQRAVAAISSGKFQDEIVPLTVKQYTVDEAGKVHIRERIFDKDEGARPDTTLEALAKLKPVFHVQGSVTAGNSSQTSDGAAAVIVMSADKAAELGVSPIAKFRSFTVGGVDPDVMGIGPVVAIPKALKLAGISLDDVDLFELNEAFASQSIAVIRELGLDPEKVNVNGGAIALGHPLGCSGAKLTVSLLNEMKRRGGKYGVVTMCIGGGMGAAGVFEMI
ncbi:acetyl-CoA acetyltransferase [Brevibacillus agri]|uniref:acetyl-CoA C-acyltransferase n=1 Tax=Brevibacillus agri TaxID=51101 RepID=A0A3M8ARY3_9BACL|nr:MULTISPECIES: acetyl-CoA C-acetyltransferase [Brevibacillus]ELK44044.1 acetyl-CoA C-acyltransferase [Brevibacillus agri BAB-2500]EJL38908.1 acetyl-CoA acetyltransferase [Brevibacillus sp. CF112]MBG9567995.1 acetyl-CoA acetyltransferase [Brevibacillus agri]MBY0050676.1 acetyl-CoA C-acetyltransferase [Brevibacillus agri]MDN4095136.1 acetyl-CoA C-acetyltransferase [Brevibacillus agri]